MLTIREPKLTEPKEYVMVRRKAPRVAPEGIPPDRCEQKYQDP